MSTPPIERVASWCVSVTTFYRPTQAEPPALSPCRIFGHLLYPTTLSPCRIFGTTVLSVQVHTICDHFSTSSIGTRPLLCHILNPLPSSGRFRGLKGSTHLSWRPHAFRGGNHSSGSKNRVSLVFRASNPCCLRPDVGGLIIRPSVPFFARNTKTTTRR